MALATGNLKSLVYDASFACARVIIPGSVTRYLCLPLGPSRKKYPILEGSKLFQDVPYHLVLRVRGTLGFTLWHICFSDGNLDGHVLFCIPISCQPSRLVCTKTKLMNDIVTITKIVPNSHGAISSRAITLRLFYVLKRHIFNRNICFGRCIVSARIHSTTVSSDNVSPIGK